ncbi:MAG: HAD-IA family hydrolase, partial [Proteobacteria bacterium]|nr:HAD-IA family hydrolase [Pseudomonadota bacterium]
AMLAAVATLREAGLRVAALTNNWGGEDDGDGTRVLQPHFDIFIESSVEGLRKPDPRIYELACERLAVGPEQAIFLDDIGANLKPARQLGMTTIRVVEPAAALEELGSLLELSLGAGNVA